jgi:hypothetical protein
MTSSSSPCAKQTRLDTSPTRRRSRPLAPQARRAPRIAGLRAPAAAAPAMPPRLVKRLWARGKVTAAPSASVDPDGANAIAFMDLLTGRIAALELDHAGVSYGFIACGPLPTLLPPAFANIPTRGEFHIRSNIASGS